MDVAIDFSYKVTLIRYIDDAVLPTRFTLCADLIPIDNVIDIDFDIAFTKIKFWFDTIVSRSIVFSGTNTLALDMLLDENGKPRTVNHLMITPEEPNDDHLAVVFQSKMEALAKGKIHFGCVRVEADSSSGLVYTYVGNWQEDLPSMKEWFDKEPYYFNDPWWARDDASTLDLMPAGDDIDFSVRPTWAMALDFIETAIRPAHPVDSPMSDVIIKGAFKPKVINGGKDDK